MRSFDENEERRVRFELCREGSETRLTVNDVQRRQESESESRTGREGPGEGEEARVAERPSWDERVGGRSGEEEDGEEDET